MVNRETKHSTPSATTKLNESSASNAVTNSATLNCPTCQSVLVADEVKAGQQIRCGRCSAITKFGQSESLPADKLAWRSFWLGLSSFFLLFLTGIPAVYYGVKSLLRMRFSRPKTSDRVAAIIGTGAGGCFGVMFGSMFTIVALITVVVAMSSERSNERQVVEAEFTKCCKVDFPEDLIGNRYRSIRVNSGGQTAFYFSDNEDPNDADLWIKIVHFKATSKMEQSLNGISAAAQIFDFRMPEETPLKSETLQWDIGGQMVKVTKHVYEVEPKNSINDSAEVETLHRFHATFECETDVYGFCIVANVTRRPISDQELERIWTDFKSADELENAPPSEGDPAEPNDKAVTDGK